MSPRESKDGEIQRVGSFRRAIRRIRTFSKSIVHIASNSYAAYTSESQTRCQELQQIKYHLDQFSFEKEDSSESPDDWFSSIGEVSGTYDAGFYHALTTDHPCQALPTLPGPTNTTKSERFEPGDPLRVLNTIKTHISETSPHPPPTRASKLSRKLQRWPCQRQRLEQQNSQKARRCYFSKSLIPRPQKSLSRPRKYASLSHLPERPRSTYRPRIWGTATAHVLRLTASPVSDEHNLFDYNSIPLSARLSGSYDCLPFTKRRQRRRKPLADVFSAQAPQNTGIESNMATVQKTNPESGGTKRLETSIKDGEVFHNESDSLSGGAEQEQTIVSPAEQSPSMSSSRVGKNGLSHKVYRNVNPLEDIQLGSPVSMNQKGQQEAQTTIGIATENVNKIANDQLEVPWIPPPPRSLLRPNPYFGSISPSKDLCNQSISPEIESEREKALRRKSGSTLAILSDTTSPKLTSVASDQSHVKLLDRTVPPIPAKLGWMVRCPKQALEDGSPISARARSRPPSPLSTEPPQHRVAQKIGTNGGTVALPLSSAGEDGSPSVHSSPSQPDTSKVNGNGYSNGPLQISPQVYLPSSKPVSGHTQGFRPASTHYDPGVDQRGNSLPRADQYHSKSWEEKQPMSGNSQDERSCPQWSVSLPVEAEGSQGLLDTKRGSRKAAKHHAIVPKSTLVCGQNQVQPIRASAQPEQEFCDVIRKTMKHHRVTVVNNSPFLPVGTRKDDIEEALMAAAKHLDLKTPMSMSTSVGELGCATSSLKSPSIRSHRPSYREQVEKHFFPPHTSPAIPGRPHPMVLTSPSLPILEDGLSILAPRAHCGRPNPKLKSRWNRQRRLQEAGAYALSPVAMANNDSAVDAELGSKSAMHRTQLTHSAPRRPFVESSHRDARPPLVPTLICTSASPPSSLSDVAPPQPSSNAPLLSSSNTSKSGSLLCPPSQGPSRTKSVKKGMFVRAK